MGAKKKLLLNPLYGKAIERVGQRSVAGESELFNKVK